jgi:hypothetical protein
LFANGSVMDRLHQFTRDQLIKLEPNFANKISHVLN